SQRIKFCSRCAGDCARTPSWLLHAKEAGAACVPTQGAQRYAAIPKMTSPGAAVPKTAAPGDAELEEREVGREERRDDYYFFFAVLRTDRLRAGAAFFARFLVDFFFIAITRLLSLWSCAAAHARRHALSTTPRRLINLYHGSRIPTGRWASPYALRRCWSAQHNRRGHRTLPVVCGLQPDDRLIMSARLRGALGWRA